MSTFSDSSSSSVGFTFGLALLLLRAKYWVYLEKKNEVVCINFFLTYEKITDNLEGSCWNCRLLCRDFAGRLLEVCF